MTTTAAQETTSSITIEAWRDPVIDGVGHDPRTSYVETFWLPILGPSTTWFLRHVATRLDADPAGFVLDCAETSRALGLGERSGRNAPFSRTLSRSVDFEMAQWRAPARLAVRRQLPPLARRHLLRLTAGLRRRHDAYVLGQQGAHPVDRLRHHGRQLALSLLELGEDRGAAEHQLLVWRFHPSLARECADWADARRTHPVSGPGATAASLASAKELLEEAGS